MRIALAQINSRLGDFATNRRKIVEYCRQAQQQGADLVVFPELSLMGYLPNDLLERPSIVKTQLKEFAQLQREIPSGLGVLVGLVTENTKKKGKPFLNSAALLVKGQRPKFFHKELLPAYDVFDEPRHLEKGEIKKGFFTFKGRRFLLTICEDIWGWALPDHPTNYLENPLLALKAKKVDVVLNMSASPFTYEKAKDRKAVVSRTAKLLKAPLVYVNMVGGQDEIIFDGGSFVYDPKGSGRIVAQSRYFNEDLNIFDLSSRRGEIRKVPQSRIEQIRQALVLGIRDYLGKTGFTRVHLGLSGGIDSAVVACLAVEALGSESVSGMTLPGPFNEPRSKNLGEELARNLNIKCFNLNIEPAYQTTLSILEGSFGKFDFGIVNENLQSRLRGLLLMAYSNKESSLLLTTGNKSEYATGYATLYGDMCGGLAPIADLTKGEVYALAELYNRDREVIPREIITRPPSAELRPNQKDQDSLPPYEELDASVKRLVEMQKPARSRTDHWLLKVLFKTEFKRWQAAPVLKVSRHAFGKGRRMPLAHRAKD